MNMARKLRLGPLPTNSSTKLTFACPASLKMDLDRYAALHAQTYGEAVDAATLIPHVPDALKSSIIGICYKLWRALLLAMIAACHCPFECGFQVPLHCRLSLNGIASFDRFENLSVLIECDKPCVHWVVQTKQL